MTDFSFRLKNVAAVVVCLAAWVFSANAQDIITLKNGDEIRARVTEIGTTEIRYKRFENIDGPTIVLARSDVFLIRYENGTRDVINPITPNTSTGSTNTRNDARKGDIAMGVNAAVGLGTIFPNYGFGAKLQGYISDKNRLEGAFVYFLPEELSVLGIEMRMNMWNISANWHFLFSTSNRVMFYSLLGVGIVGVTTEFRTLSGDFGEPVSENEFCFNLGGGMDIKLSNNWDFNAMLKYKKGNNWDFLRISTGFTYNF